MGLFSKKRDDDDDDMEPGNPDQPPPMGLCPQGGHHDWVYSGHIRTCSKCTQSENV